jgi:hypothetical protein
MSRLVEYHSGGQSLAFTTDSLSSIWLNPDNNEIQIVTTNWIFTLPHSNAELAQLAFDTLTRTVAGERKNIYQEEVAEGRKAKNGEGFIVSRLLN